jgi:DNA polymerase III delta prime subunit
METKFGIQIPQLLPAETTIESIYERTDIGGRLLILGNPGAGKTTTLLQLAKSLAEIAQIDNQQPIPVLFNLSSWGKDNQSLKEWLLEELQVKVKIKDCLNCAAQYLDRGLIIPLLDGLNEVAPKFQNSCVEAINEFLQSAGKEFPLVVCSRREEYEYLKKRLNLNSSVIIQPLNQAQIKDYIERSPAEILWDILQADSDLMELARIPFFLTIMVVAYEQLSLNESHGFQTSKERQDYLLRQYLQKMLNPRKLRYTYQEKLRRDKKNQSKWQAYLKYAKDPRQTYLWLGWLARNLQKSNQAEFFLEDLQPSWLTTGRWFYKIIPGFSWIILMLLIGFISGLLMASIKCISLWINNPPIDIIVAVDIFKKQVLIWVVTSGLLGIISVLPLVILFYPTNTEIKTVELLYFNNEKLKKLINCRAIISGITIGFLFGVAGGFFHGISEGTLIGSLMIGIILGSILGLFMSVAMISIKSFDERTNKTYNLNDKIEAYPPNEFRLGIYPMLIESLIIWLIFGAISGLLMLLAVIFVGFYNEREKTASQRYYDKNYAIKASLSNGFTLAMLLIGIWIPLYFMFNLILGNLHLNAKIISDSQLLLKQSILICFIVTVQGVS